jgi:hypothetical protein
MTDITRTQSIKLAIELFGIFLIVLAIISLSEFLSSVAHVLLSEWYPMSMESTGIWDEVYDRMNLQGIIRRTALKSMITSGVFTVVYVLAGGYFLRGADLVQDLLITGDSDGEDAADTSVENGTDGDASAD